MSGVHIRADDSVWEDLKAATNGKQAEITRQFWAWYVRRPGAKLPRRPPHPRTPDSTLTTERQGTGPVPSAD